MNPEQAGKYLFDLLTSVSDGDIQVTVSRSSLLPACTIKVVRRYASYRPEIGELYTSDEFSEALEKVRDGL